MSYNEFIKPFVLEYLDGANLKIRFSSKNNQPKHFDPINSLGAFTLPVLPKPLPLATPTRSVCGWMRTAKFAC